VWTVTRLDEGREFVWETTRLGLTMTGSHVMEQLGDNCRNTLTIDVQGRGAALFGRLFGRAIRKALATENSGFRAKAEELSRRAA
jgi:hypothetical protein